MSEPLHLDVLEVVDLIPTAPFNFDATLHKPDHYPTNDTAWEPGVRWQTMRWQGMLLGLKLEESGALERPCIRLSVYSQEGLEPAYLEGLLAEIQYRCNLQMDLDGFNRRFKDHPHLGPVISRWRGMRPTHLSSLYEYLVIAILLQNATVRRTVSMHRALFEAYGRLVCYDEKQLYGFWEPEALDSACEEELRALKVGYRAKSLKRVSASFTRKEIDELVLRGQSREEQRRALLELYGIGPASVGYLLFDVFHQFDEMDHISPWEQKIYSRLFFGVDPGSPLPVEQLLAYFKERFEGYRGLAVHYFWEDLFWKRQHEPVPWLEELIRL